MTTSISLDHSKRLKQSFAELSYQAESLCRHIDALKAKTNTQIIQLTSVLSKRIDA